MAIKINFDCAHNVQSPTYVLATRNGKRLGKLPAYNITFKDSLNSYSEIFFRVSKKDNPLWNLTKDFKLMYCREYDRWYEIYVEIDESNDVVKNVTAKSLGEAELSQINLYGTEINTELDISRDDYKPTILYDEGNPDTSLLNRITAKAPHYKIAHVDISISRIQRTFSFDGISIYDALQEIAQEINCIFLLDVRSDGDGNLLRTISAYDLESYCPECGARDDFLDICPECGSSNILTGYGNDTTIFISTDGLAEDIQYSANVDSVKNCFKLVAGDDLMTATLINCNPNGSGYIWYVSDDVKEDMSYELVSKLAKYDEAYRYFQIDYESVVPDYLFVQYNALIDKYSAYSDTLSKMPNNIKGYPALMNAYYNTIDLYLFLNNELMPNAELPETSADVEASKLNAANLSTVAVQDIEKITLSTASSAVLAMAKTIVDPRYQVKISAASLDSVFWTGSFCVENYSDEEDTATSESVSLTISDNYEEFVRQKIDKVLNSNYTETTDIVSLFKLKELEFTNKVKEYSLVRLSAIYDACQACIDILIEQGVSNKESYPDLYDSLYIPYYNKLSLIQTEIAAREKEISLITGSTDSNGTSHPGVQTILEQERNSIQDALDFESFLGEDLWLEFAAYRREDTYQNDNYISDGLNNAELFQNALEFIEVAKKDIYKSATLQHSITASLKNLLALKDFEPIVDYFEIGNWIRVKVDNTLCKLRIVEYEIDYDNLNNVSIVFSDVVKGQSGLNDVESILGKATSMATSYSSVSRQASQGKRSNDQIDDWVSKGLSLTKMKIVDKADNQNITWDSHGLLCKEYLPVSDEYDPKQLKLINRGIYLTDDNWLTSRAGIGDFTFYNPSTGQMEESYGVIADTLVGNLILSEKVGIYNAKNSITLDENGVVITADDSNQTIFTIQKKSLDTDGSERITQTMYIDSEGNLVLNGTIRINSASDTNIATLDDLADTNRFEGQIRKIANNESKAAYKSIQAKYDDLCANIEDQLNNYKAEVGQYMSFGEDGLILGAQSSAFKTVIDNRGVYFKQGDTNISYVNNNQLYIPNAAIMNSLILGGFFLSPRSDGGVSLTWQGATA